MNISTIIDFFSTYLKNTFYLILYHLKRVNWITLLLGLLSVEIAALSYLNMNNDQAIYNSKLETLITVSGLFSAILITYLFNRISKTIESKDEIYKEALEYSAKITDLRRILKLITDYYGVWNNDKATKSLFLNNKFRNIDFYEFTIGTTSTDRKQEQNTVDILTKDPNYNSVYSAAYLGIISLIYNRKVHFDYREELYKDFQTKGVYSYNFINRCMEVEHLSRLSLYFKEGYNLINYANLSTENQENIMVIAKRINKKYGNYSLDNKLMAELLEDMHEHYFKELYKLLKHLKKGITGMNFLLFIMLISQMTLGLFIPFTLYFLKIESSISSYLTNVAISINIGLLFFFISNLFSYLQREVKYE